MSSSSDWCTIESDPGVFTSLIESFGVEGVEVTELWSLDDDSLATLGPTHGLIFLFKWVQQMEATDTRPVLKVDEIPEQLFFAKQMITNACATQALLSVLLNQQSDSQDVSFKLGDLLSNLKEFTMALDPEMRGEAIGNSEETKKAHNEFGRSDDPFIRDLNDNANMKSEGDAFHFIAFIPFDGKVYELDGLKQGPIFIGDEVDMGEGSAVASWLVVARQAIQERIERYAAEEVKFNLMALVQDRRISIEKALEIATAAGEEDERNRLHADMIAEQQKREMWSKENERRKHNYVPFVFELLKAMASSGNLNEISKKANDTYSKKRKKMHSNAELFKN